MLEDNWRGPVAENDGIEKALAHWQAIARRCGDVSKNWRLELFLYKAFIDAYIQRKRKAEMQYEAEAYNALRSAEKCGVMGAIQSARTALARMDKELSSPEDLRQELYSWGLSKYQELDKILENLYHALNDRQWLEAEFERILAMKDEDAQVSRI